MDAKRQAIEVIVIFGMFIAAIVMTKVFGWFYFALNGAFLAGWILHSLLSESK